MKKVMPILIIIAVPILIGIVMFLALCIVAVSPLILIGYLANLRHARRISGMAVELDEAMKLYEREKRRNENLRSVIKTLEVRK